MQNECEYIVPQDLFERKKCFMSEAKIFSIRKEIVDCVRNRFLKTCARVNGFCRLIYFQSLALYSNQAHICTLISYSVKRVPAAGFR